MPQLELILLVGSYAQRWHLGAAAGRQHDATSSSAGASCWTPRHGRACLPLPHPSWRNNAWLTANPWFERELLPRLRREITAAALRCQALV